MPVRATEDFSIDRVAFSWRARFPINRPLAVRSSTSSPMATADSVVSLFGIPLKTMKGPETDVGEAMRYLSELKRGGSYPRAASCTGADTSACSNRSSRRHRPWRLLSGRRG